MNGENKTEESGGVFITYEPVKPLDESIGGIYINRGPVE